MNKKLRNTMIVLPVALGLGFLVYQGVGSPQTQRDAASTQASAKPAPGKVRSESRRSLDTNPKLAAAVKGLSLPAANDQLQPLQEQIDALKLQIDEIDERIAKDDLVARANEGTLSAREVGHLGTLLDKRADLSIRHANTLLEQIAREDES